MKSLLLMYIGLLLPNLLFAQIALEDDSINVSFLNSDITLSEIQIISKKKNIDSHGLGNMKINIEQLRISPLFFGERDIIKTIQFLPGISSGMDGSSQLNIRGGTNDQTLYLMDDVPVYNQNHTFGFFSIFNADALKSVDVYKGGIPSMYGDRLSGVASIALKDGDLLKHNNSLTLGLLAGTIASEGPIVKEKLSYSVAARRSFLDLLHDGMTNLASNSEGGTTMISFYDVNGKLSWQIKPNYKLTWQIYAGYDDLYGKNMKESNNNNSAYFEKFGFGWETLMNSFRFTSELSDNLSMASTAYYTRLNNFNYFFSEEKKEGTKSSSKANTSFLLNEFGVRTSLKHKLGKFNTLNYGIDASSQVYRPDYLQRKTDKHVLEVRKEILNLCALSAFIYDEYLLNNWLFGVGFRTSLYNNTNKTLWVVEPRLKINTFLGEKNKLMFAFDYMNQPVHSINEMNYSVQADFWIPFKEDILPVSHQFSIGWKSYLNKYLTFSVEAYSKKMENLLLIKNIENYIDFHTDYETGIGNSTGIELMVEYSRDNFTSWGAYTLSQTKRCFEGKSYPFKYDSPHDFSFFTGYRLHETNKSHNYLSVNIQYKSGYPYCIAEMTYPGIGLPTHQSGYNALTDISFVDYIPNYPNVRLNDYFRVDLNFTMTQKMKRGSRIWQFSLMNATAHENSYAVYKKDGKYKSFVLIPFLPSVSFTRQF